jgi:hypothetical protein
MPISEPLLCFASSAVEIHPCAGCHAPMLLARPNTARPDFDVRTFECFNCDHPDPEPAANELTR